MKIYSREPEWVEFDNNMLDKFDDVVYRVKKELNPAVKQHLLDELEDIREAIHDGRNYKEDR